MQNDFAPEVHTLGHFTAHCIIMVYYVLRTIFSQYVLCAIMQNAQNETSIVYSDIILYFVECKWMHVGSVCDGYGIVYNEPMASMSLILDFGI